MKMDTPRRLQRVLHLENVQQFSTPINIPPSPFMKHLGYGTGVNVYRLERSPKCDKLRSPWAVKRISQRSNTDRADLFNKRIREEADILRKLSHPNIVGFRGITKSPSGVDTLILECLKTSLGSILEERYEEEMGPLSANNTLKMILDVSHGLDYLHTEAKILHGDLKSYNVLVKGDFEICKLCDFGVSLPLDENGTIDFTKNPNLQYVGTDTWSAPEVMDELEIIDSKADIFSFGLIIYETIALVPPHSLKYTKIDDNEEKENDSSIVANGETDASIEDSTSYTSESYTENMIGACGTRPPLPQAFELQAEYDNVVELFYCCTNELAEDRPTARIIWQSVEKLQAGKKQQLPKYEQPADHGNNDDKCNKYATDNAQTAEPPQVAENDQ